MANGDLREIAVNTNRDMASIADWYTWKDYDIAGDSGDHIVDGYCVVAVKWPGLALKQVNNQSTSASATFIGKTLNGADEATIAIAAASSSGKLPEISHIKVTGTSDNLTLFFQKKEA